jgi:hypothetical protein
MPADRRADDPDAVRTPAAVAELMSQLLHGCACPCRFPRFRATVERETLSFGAPLMTWEQYLLIASFDGAVSLVHRRPLVTRGEGTGHEGNCVRCGAFVRRRSEEKFRDQWIEHMVVQPCPGLEDRRRRRRPCSTLLAVLRGREHRASGCGTCASRCGSDLPTDFSRRVDYMDESAPCATASHLNGPLRAAQKAYLDGLGCSA